MDVAKYLLDGISRVNIAVTRRYIRMYIDALATCIHTRNYINTIRTYVHSYICYVHTITRSYTQLHYTYMCVTVSTQMHKNMYLLM